MHKYNCIKIKKKEAMLLPGVSKEAVAALPAHVKGVNILQGVSKEAVAALPAHVRRVDIGSGVSKEVVAALPAHVKWVGIVSGVSKEVVAALPAHIKVVGIVSGVSKEVVAALLAHVNRVVIGPGVSTDEAQLIKLYFPQCFQGNSFVTLTDQQFVELANQELKKLISKYEGIFTKLHKLQLNSHQSSNIIIDDAINNQINQICTCVTRIIENGNDKANALENCSEKDSYWFWASKYLALQNKPFDAFKLFLNVQFNDKLKAFEFNNHFCFILESMPKERYDDVLSSLMTLAWSHTNPGAFLLSAADFFTTKNDVGHVHSLLTATQYGKTTVLQKNRATDRLKQIQIKFVPGTQNRGIQTGNEGTNRRKRKQETTTFFSDAYKEETEPESKRRRLKGANSGPFRYL